MKYSRNLKLTQAELFSIFPEAKYIVPDLLKEFMQQHDSLVNTITNNLSELKKDTTDEFDYFFWRTWLKLTIVQDLVELDRHIACLSRHLRFINGKPNNASQLSEDQIDAARCVPIESLVDGQFRKSGRDLVCICPLHDEKTPSFHIYTSQNRAWCFGCNQGGDSIWLVMMMHEYSFKNAVISLTGDQF